MDPFIQYANTHDGVGIAFWVLGSGPPLLHFPGLPLSNLQTEWEMPQYRQWFERLAETHTVIHFDARGTGLSERDVADLSLDAHVLDVEAVLAKAGVPKTDLFAGSYSGPVGIRFAARRPEAVNRFVLWCTHARHNEVTAKMPPHLNDQRVAVNRLAEVDWDLYIRTYLYRAAGWTEGNMGNQLAALARTSIDPSKFIDALAQYAAFDAVEDLGNVQAETMVLHRPEFVGSNVDVARGLAARIPRARLVLLDGSSVAPFIGDTEAIIGAINSFLDEGRAWETGNWPESRAPGQGGEAGALRTIVFAEVDAAGLMQAHGEKQARELLRDYGRDARGAIQRFGGGDIKALGGGIVGSFGSAQMALECAINLQREAAGRVGEDFRLRVGINTGEPFSGEDDLFAAAVLTAGRIATAGHGGEILVPSVVRELVAGKGFSFGERGELRLGDSEDATRVYELFWNVTAPR